jgi:nucleoside-diphosphate-sugar epimerase
MDNLYRESFVFDCAKQDRKFYLPGDGSMKLQFFHVEDLCKLMEKIINTKPEDHILNVGNKDAVTIKEWVDACYASLGKTPEYVNVTADIEQRLYFSFYNYEYYLDVSKMLKLLPETKELNEGLLECAAWYEDNESEVRKKPMIEYIDNNLRGSI